MFFFSLGDSGESVFVLGDDKDVNGGCRSDIPEGEDFFVLVDDAGGYFFPDEFIKNGFLGHIRYVYIPNPRCSS